MMVGQHQHHKGDHMPDETKNTNGIYLRHWMITMILVVVTFIVSTFWNPINSKITENMRDIQVTSIELEKVRGDVKVLQTQYTSIQTDLDRILFKLDEIQKGQ
jgi:hypothetical protein